MEQATTTTRYRRAGGDSRGSSYARRRRKQWMLSTWGDGHHCPCVHCGCELDYDSVQADRIKPGGSYSIESGNVQPSCGLCNKRRSNNPLWRAPVTA